MIIFTTIRSIPTSLLPCLVRTVERWACVRILRSRPFPAQLMPSRGRARNKQTRWQDIRQIKSDHQIGYNTIKTNQHANKPTGWTAATQCRPCSMLWLVLAGWRMREGGTKVDYVTPNDLCDGCANFIVVCACCGHFSAFRRRATR